MLVLVSITVHSICSVYSVYIVTSLCIHTCVQRIIVCVCMYVFMYSIFYVCMYSILYVCMYSILYVCMYSILYECMYSILYVCMYSILYECMYIILYYMYACMCLQVYLTQMGMQ